MEVVTSLSTNINGANGGTKKHIQEWSRLDKLTGMLEHARVEADHWASNTSNSRHHFGKVVDSRARNLADGSVQQKQQTKQLEVFQAHIPGGSVQVIRSHTSTTSSWHNSKVLQSRSSNWSSSPADNLLNRHIGDMEVQIDNLKFDHNPVNLDSQKSKANVARHLGNRRPPTRSKMPRINDDNTVSTYLPITYNFHEVNEENKNKLNNDIAGSTDSTEISSFSSSANASVMESNRKKLDKKKSISNENLSFTSHADSEEADEKKSSYPWIRSSLARRSYQHPPTSRYKMKMENSAEFVPGNKSDLENVLGKVLRHRTDFESWSKMPSSVELQKPTPLLHKKSFVTEATLQETKRKLRPLTNDETSAILRSSLEEIDDGVFTESKSNSDRENEKTNISEDLDDMVIKSTSPKCLDFRLVNKSDDWLDRRKSYGFEPVGQPNIISSLNSTPKTNSSTDSGICRSSELELVSTSIVKKVTETKDDCVIHSSKDKEIKPRSESTVKNEVLELLKKLEKFDKLKTSGATNVKFTESQDVIKKGKVLEAIKNFEKNGINHKTPELTSMTKSGSYFLEDLNEKTSQLAIEPDFLAKRHSIACDDTKYVASTITIPEPSLPEKALFPGKSKIVNLNNFESSNASSPFTDTDAKKPKKVEFSRTEVHFAATEPGKIRIVETDEKPPPTNLYRKKKRSISVSPKSDLPQTKSNVFENLTNPENSQNNNLDEDSPGFRSHFTSTVSDNGLAVTITSAKPNDYRRASWSVIENSSSSPMHLENKVGYSTKINFGGEGITVVADAKSAPHEKPACESHISTTKTTNKTKIPDEISEKCHFKPLKNDADEFKIIANVTDIKKPKIALVATIKLNNNSPETENSSTISKKSTILLNKSPRIEGVFKDAITKEDDDVKKTHTSRRIGITDPNSSKINDYVNVADYRKPKQQNHLTRTSAEEFSKNDNDPVEVIHHDIKLIEKVGRKENGKKPYLVRKDVGRESMKHGEKIAPKDSIVNNGNIRRSTKSVNIKGKLPDSGRDSWLNLPKERKTLFEKKPTENGKHEIYRKPHIDHVKKDRRTRSGINGCGDISSEEDLMKKSSKVYIPLSTIHEKSQITKSSKLPITKMASNSSTENQSSLFEFKNPVLKTEERSRRRAARILQRASSREMLMSSNIASSSDDITSENEHHHLRISKPRCIRKSKSSPKTTKSVSATSNLPPKKIVTSSAKMQINIFNIKDRINNEIRSTHAHNTSSKSSNCADDVKSLKCRPPTSRQKTYANVPEKSRTKLVSCSNRDSKNLSTMAVKSTRPIR